MLKQILDDFFLFHFSIDSEEYTFYEKWTTNKANCSDPKKLFESITFKKGDVIKETWYWGDSFLFDENNKHWHPIDNFILGHCFTLNTVSA